ncbi:MAG TPA: nucleoside-diphosphate kinase [bacterium]|nr:nucleoside-diphosphate kinase [bacterium]
MEQTLSIIKPDGVRKNHIGEILRRFEAAGLTIRATKLVRMSKADAQAFYAVHKERPFYDSLTDFMSSGPVVVSVLEGPGAIAKNREIMGATNPKDAAEGTIRKDFAENVEINTVHGSDAPETAAQEIGFFFAERELLAGQR